MELDVLLFSASPRKKGNTVYTLEHAKKYLEDFGAKTEIVHLHDYKLVHCTGCLKCMRESDTCVMKDGLPELNEYFHAAKSFIIGSPLYINFITGPLKTFFDRNFHWVHRPGHIKKYAMFNVVSGHYSFVDQVEDYIRDIFTAWGSQYLGINSFVSYGMHKFSNKEQDFAIYNKKLDNLVYSLRKNPVLKPDEKQIQYFDNFKKLFDNPYSIEELPLDYQFWKEKGLFEKNYYYEY